MREKREDLLDPVRARMSVETGPSTPVTGPPSTSFCLLQIQVSPDTVSTGRLRLTSEVLTFVEKKFRCEVTPSTSPREIVSSKLEVRITS